MYRKMFRIYLRIALPVILAVFIIPDLILGLRDVSVTVPTAVKRGDDAHLICNYDMENDTLYSVKWYKGRREFYRYTPKENPAMKIFPTTGVNVKQMSSNQSHVTLTNVQLNLSGKFSCEVSADAPSFHTTIVSGNMEVVELPEQRPIITGIHSRYRMGDLINGNCSSEFSKPAANLTWTINGIQVMPNQVKHFEVQKNPVDNLEASVAEVSFIVNHLQFIHGRLKLKCSARIHNIYQQESEKIIEEDRPRILASGRSPELNNLYPFDQQSDGEFPDPNEYYYKETNSANSLLKCKNSYTFSSIFSTSKITMMGKFILIINVILKNFGILLISTLISIIFLINNYNLNNFLTINLLNNNFKYNNNNNIKRSLNVKLNNVSYNNNNNNLLKLNEINAHSSSSKQYNQFNNRNQQPEQQKQQRPQQFQIESQVNQSLLNSCQISS
ncbi:putative actin-fragmin kinase DDB_G0287957 isoform X2 [Condylostylus longicornis]|uniref:putative actin-fragmin kinase DDB_G0287957 isoform X2 n=1 Tax=Condylostylus longicornis TaxID=2530218 RepID=UPI00244E3F56|nr:putative actin-fragmin kinase DDB_G0287957 isoform X2 [Condylostylus longicornis]